jgi:hypothetical protein
VRAPTLPIPTSQSIRSTVEPSVRLLLVSLECVRQEPTVPALPLRAVSESVLISESTTFADEGPCSSWRVERDRGPQHTKLVVPVDYSTQQPSTKKILVWQESSQIPRRFVLPLPAGAQYVLVAVLVHLVMDGASRPDAVRDDRNNNNIKKLRFASLTKSCWNDASCQPPMARHDTGVSSYGP